MAESSKIPPASSVHSVLNLVIEDQAADLDYVTNQYEILWRNYDSVCALLSVAVGRVAELTVDKKELENQLRRLMGVHDDGGRWPVPPKEPLRHSIRREGGMVQADEIDWEAK